MKKRLMVSGIVGALMLAASPARAKVEITSTVISGGDLKGSIEVTGDAMYELTSAAMAYDFTGVKPRSKTTAPGKKALGLGYTLEISAFDPGAKKVKPASFVIYPFAEGGPLTSVVHKTRFLGQKLTTGFYLADPSMTELLVRVGVQAPRDFGAAATGSGTSTIAADTTAARASSPDASSVTLPFGPLSLGVLLVAGAITLLLRRSRSELLSA